MRLFDENTAGNVYFHLVETDGITPALGEAGGQPQVSIDGAAWTSSGIGVLVAVGNGRYYAVLAGVSGVHEVETRYKSASTAECPGDSVEIVGEAAGRAAGFWGKVRRTWEWVANLRDRDRATGDLTLYGGNGTTPLETQVQSSSGTVDQQSKGS